MTPEQPVGSLVDELENRQEQVLRQLAELEEQLMKVIGQSQYKVVAASEKARKAA